MAGMLSAFGPQGGYAAQQTPWGFSPFAQQGLSVPPQVLQTMPHQLQQVQYLQQQQLQLLQHLLQVLPQQLHQIQQVVQFVPLQIQQLQQQLQSTQTSFGQPITGLGFGAPGMTPQGIGGGIQASPFFASGIPGQSGHVM